MSELKAKFRDGLRDFYKNYYDIDEQSLSDKQRSEGLGLFYLTEILAKMNPGSIPEDPKEIEQYIVDGSYDQGIDFLISQENHHILVQCKYRGKKKTEDKHEVETFRGVFSRIHPEVGREHKKNELLMDALDDIDWRNDTFQLLFISLGKTTDDIKIYERKELPEIDHPDLRDISYRTEFRFLAEEDLNIEYRNSMNQNLLKDVKITAQKDSHGNHWYCYNNGVNLRSFITTLSATKIYELYKFGGNREALFNLNIRNFIGDTSTNKKIIKTAEEEPENFFFYNNGISAVASEIDEDVETGILSCKNFSIINGAQSFRSIEKAFHRTEGQTKEKIKKLSVMLRITEKPDLLKKSEFIDRITQYNNTQNAVKISDFRSNDDVQNSLVHCFERKSYAGKKYHYKKKRGEKNERNSITINLDDFCKIIHSFLKGPVDFFGGVSHLYDISPNGGYHFLFGDEQSGSIAESLSKESFDELAAIFFICEHTRILFANQKKERQETEKQQREDDNSPLISSRALEGKYLIFYALGQTFANVAVRKRKTIKEFLVEEKFSNPNWKDNEKKQKLIYDLVSLCCDTLVGDYSFSSEKSDFVHRNWFRDKDTLKRLKMNLLNANHGRLKEIFDRYFD